MYSFGVPTFQPEKFHHGFLLFLLHLSSITDFINHKDLERFISFWDYLYGTFFMTVCRLWFSLMTQEGEIGIKSSAPGDNRGTGDFLYPCSAVIDGGSQEAAGL
jgi:hypothetical protein